MPGAPVLLVHGLAGSAASTWGEAGWVDLLADARREAITPNLPGHAGEPLLDEPDFGRWVLDVLDRHAPGGGVVDAIGFSFGARSILRAAGLAPERFGRIVLAGIGNGVFDPPTGASQLADVLESGAQGSGVGAEGQAAGIARYFLEQTTVAGTDPADLVHVMRNQGPPPARDDVGRIASPVVVAIGERDFAGPADQIAAAVPGARYVELRGLEHFATPKAFEFIDLALEHVGAAP